MAINSSARKIFCLLLIHSDLQQQQQQTSQTRTIMQFAKKNAITIANGDKITSILC